MSALQAAALTGDVAVRLGVVALLLVFLVWLLLLAVRPARAAAAFIAPGAGARLRALAAAARARHEAGLARLAAFDAAETRRATPQHGRRLQLVRTGRAS